MRYSWLTLGLLPMSVAGSAWAQGEQAPSLSELNGHEERVLSLANKVAAGYGFDRVKAFAMAWVAVHAELQGEGRAEDVLRSLAEADDVESMVASLSKDEFHALTEALERLSLDQAAQQSLTWFALMKRLNEEAVSTTNTAPIAGAGGASSGMSSSATGQAAENGQHRESVPMFSAPTPSFGSFSGGGVSCAPLPPSGHNGSDHDTIADEPEPTPPQQKQESEEEKTEQKQQKQEESESQDTLKTAAFSAFSVGGGFAPRMMMMRAMAMPLADVPASIEVADGTSQSVMMPTEVYSVTLGSGSTLYVADALTLSHELTVQDDSRLVVKDGGVVQLGTYSDSQSAATNKNVALLFNALLHSTTTEGSGVVKIDSVSVQFGDGSAYNLADAETGLNAVFDARYEIAKDLQLQNYNQGLAHSKNPTQVAASSWQISESGDVHVKGDLKLSSYQQLDVSGGKLVVDGVATLGHTAGSAYAAKLTIADGSYVQLKQIGDARKEQDGKSELVMTGGELVFTADGNVVTNKLGGITLSGGELVADGHSWVLNHNATIGSDEGLSIRTDAAHSVTLGVAGTTTTLAGPVSVSEGSNAVLNGTYAGTGVVELADGASLTLGQNFSTAEGSSVGLSGTGTVQVNWTGALGGLNDGFLDVYHMTYSPSGLTGALNLDHAEGLVWKDAAGNTLHNVAYEDGVLTGHLVADPTVYHIVTAGHTAVYDAGGNAEGASAFALYNNGNLFIGNGSGVSAAQVTQNGHTLTLQGSGDYVLNGYTLPANVVLDADGEDKWTGAVVISGTASGTPSLNALYQQGSVIAMNGYNGIPPEWFNGTLGAGIRLDAQADGSPSWRWNNGSGSTFVTTTFQGNWSGAGDFVLGAKGGSNWRQNFTYEGDISKWTGRFLVESGTTNVTLSGKVADVYAGFDKGTGTLNLKAETDAVFYANATVNSLTVTDKHKITLAKGTEMHVTNALPSSTNLGQRLQTDYFKHVSGEGTLFLNFGASEYDQMSVTAGTTETPDVNVVFTGDSGKHQNLAISMWNATSGGLNLDHTFLVADEMTLQWGAGLTVGQTDKGAGSLVLNKLHIGHSNNANNPARVTLSGGTMMLGQIDISSAHRNTFNMTGGVLEITNSGNALTTTATGTEQTSFTLAGGALRADGAKWVWNHDAVIGEKNGSALSVETLNGGAVTIGAAGVTTTLANTIDNRGALTLDGTVNITMDASDKANGYVDQDGKFGMSVGFAATVRIPGAETYNVVTGNAADLGQHIVWKAGDKVLTVVDKKAADAPAGSYYFDGYNLRRTDEETEAEPERTGTVYYVGGRGGEYSFDKAEYAEIVTGFDIANGTLKVEVSPVQDVTLNLGAGSLQLGEKVEMTVASAQDWSMDQGASVVLEEGSVLTLPGVEPETKADSYKIYQLLNNSTGSGTIVFDGTLDVQFGNAGHNFVSPDSYNILEDNNTAETGVNADIKTNVVVKGDMLIQNYRQGKDHPEVGSQWKVSEGGSLTVHGNFESSSYQKVIVDGGDVAVDGTYKIGHEAGREYEGDLELKSGSLTVGTLQTVHEDTSTVHISGGKLTVTKGNAFANTFREVSACDAEFEGTWTWNHDATIGNITVTEGSAITLGTADTTLTLESPLKNYGALTLDGTIKADIEKQEGAWAYGTDALGYTPEGDGYYKRTDDLYTLIAEGNNATLGSNITFILNGQSLKADEFNWDGKAIGMGGTEAGTVYFLNTTNGYTYTDADTRTTAFELVNTGATLRLERDPAALETIHALGGTVSLGSGVRMESALLNAEATVTMAGEGTYLLSNNALMAHPVAHRVSFGNPAWTGTVQMSGMLGLEGSLNELGNENSWVEMQGVFGADAAPSMDVNVKLTDTAHESAWIYTGDGHDVSFTGDWAGDGTFAFAPVGGASQQLDYSGDLSAWSGAFSAEGGTAQLHFSGAGEKTVAAAMQQQGGRIELTADTDTHFTNTTQAALYAAEGGDLLADHADAASVDSIRAAGGDVTLKGLAEDTAVSLQTLVIGDSRAVTALAEGGDAAEVVLGAGSVLMAGQSATLTAGLTLESDSYISIDDRTQGLRVNGSLSLSQGIEMDDSMLQHLDTHHRLVLFSGVIELTLADGTSTSAALTAWDQTEAADYFRQVLDRLNSESGQTYYLTYSGAENGGLVCIETPEPATVTLSLLALAALFSRRRRK